MNQEKNESFNVKTRTCNRYRKASCRTWAFKISKLSHPKTVSYIESQENFTGYVMSLVRKDMESKGLESD